MIFIQLRASISAFQDAVSRNSAIDSSRCLLALLIYNDNPDVNLPIDTLRDIVYQQIESTSDEHYICIQ